MFRIRKQSEQEVLLRMYFNYKFLEAIKGIGIGILLLLIGLVVAKYVSAWALLPGIIITIWGTLWLAGGFLKPSDNKFDMWLQEGINKLIE